MQVLAVMTAEDVKEYKIFEEVVRLIHITEREYAIFILFSYTISLSFVHK